MTAAKKLLNVLLGKEVKQLSPATQAVYDAFWSHPNGKPLVQDCPDTDQLVAALRAVVQELKYFGITEKNILAIATELEETQ